MPRYAIHARFGYSGTEYDDEIEAESLEEAEEITDDKSQDD